MRTPNQSRVGQSTNYTLIVLDPALALVNSARRYRGRPLATGARSKRYRWMADGELSN